MSWRASWRGHLTPRVIPSQARNLRSMSFRAKRGISAFVARDISGDCHGTACLAMTGSPQHVIPSQARNLRFYRERHKRRLPRHYVPGNDRVASDRHDSLALTQKIIAISAKFTIINSLNGGSIGIGRETIRWSHRFYVKDSDIKILVDTPNSKILRKDSNPSMILERRFVNDRR